MRNLTSNLKIELDFREIAFFLDDMGFKSIHYSRPELSDIETIMDQLYKKAKEGDKKAEKELFQQLHVRFTTLAKRRIGKGEAEDIAQEACMTVLEKYKTESFTKGFGPWAYGVLRMKIGNYIQGQMVKEKGMVSELQASHVTRSLSFKPDYELKRKLMECLKKLFGLNPRHAELLNLFYQGFTTDEICGKLQIKPNNFYVILNRVRGQLKLCLQTGTI
jgi:RNA polymerase sigma factor (sigma-70 family)